MHVTTETQPPAVDLDRLRLDHGDDGPRATRFLPWLLLLLVVAASVIAFVMRDRFLPRDDRPTVRVASVVTERSPGSPSGAVSAAGWVKLPRYHPVHVTPLVEGRLDRLLVLEGDRVAAGQVVARLYSKDLEAELAAADAAVRVAEANHDRLVAGFRKEVVGVARAAVAELEAELATAKTILAQTEKLHPIGGVSDERLERDRRAVRTIGARLEQANEQLALKNAGYRKEDIALGAAAVAKARAQRDLAKLRLGYAEIRSPIDGVVLERRTSPGQWLRPEASTVVSVYDPGDLEARIDVDQDDVGKIRVGQSVELTTRAEPTVTQPGRVVVVEPKADVVKNIVPVRVKFLEPRGRLLYPDMVVQARFDVTPDEKPNAAARPPALLVPSDAVTMIDGQAHVYRVDGGRAKRRAVTLGDRVGARYRVLDGLEGGDRVVVSGVDALQDGERVQVKR